MSRSRKSRKSEKIGDIFEQKLIYLRELFLGRTKKQTRPDKPSFIGKPMFGMYALFTIYSFILFAYMNSVNFQTWIVITLRILCFGDPYAFGIALTFALLFLSFLFCNEKILVWTYTKLRLLKQIILFFGATGLFFGLAKYLINKRLDLYSVLLVFAMIWLIFQSVRIYSAARSGATKMEIRMSNRYSPIRYMIAYFTPFVILGVITVIAWIFRYYIVIFTLDYIGHPDKVPAIALILYRKEMEIIMPMIYTGLLSIFILMISQIILSRKKGSTARAGTFDNLVFAIISLVMFIYSLYNIALYLFLDEAFLDGFSVTVYNTNPGSGGGGVGFFFVEFLIALVFFMWIVLDLTTIFGDKGFLFFNKEGFVIFLMGTLLAQTTARLGLLTNELHFSTTFSDLIKYDYVVLPWLILLFLGVTIVVYWIKPQQMSIFLRSGKAARAEEDQSMHRVLKFLKREFIRRGEKFILSPDIINALRDMTGLAAGPVWSLIYRLNDYYIDIQLLEGKDDRGEKIVFFDFLPITEKYQKGKDAQVRAKQYLQKLFIENISNVPKRLYVPKKSQSSSTQGDLFIQALSVQYSRKIDDEAKKSLEEENAIINQAVDENTKEIVYGILQTEYLQRISQVADYRDDFRIRISEIVDRISRSTKLPITRVYSLIDEMAKENPNIQISTNSEKKTATTDRVIEIFPIDDWIVYEAIAKHRPAYLRHIRIFMQKLFETNIRYKRSKLEKLPPLVYPDETMEFERSDISRWWANAMQYFGNHFLIYQQNLNPNYLSSKFLETVHLITTAKLQEYREAHKKDNKPAYSPTYAPK